MKTILLFFYFFSITTIGLTQGNCSTKIIGNHYKGYIFPKEAELLIPFPDLISRFTPTKNEIILAESIIRDSIVNENRILRNQGKGFPIIHKKLNKYKRQYFGYINSDGDKIIWVNCIWFKKISNKISEEVIIIMDGGSYFWNIKVNLSKKKLFALAVNSNS